jgi:uncharacterized protein YjbI with pentapeptide repeats
MVVPSCAAGNPFFHRPAADLYNGGMVNEAGLTFDRRRVRPRVRTEARGAASLLEDLLTPFFDSGRPALVQLFGPAGSGKTEALACLKERFAGQPLVVRDEPPPRRLIVLDPPWVVVYTGRAADPDILLSWQMAPWTDDDCVEFVLANFRQRARSVLGRYMACAERGALGGLPALCATALEDLAADESLADLPTLFRRRLYPLFTEPGAYREASDQALLLLQDGSGPVWTMPGHPVGRLLHHPYLVSLMAQDRFVERLAGNDITCLRRLPLALRQAAAPLVRTSPQAMATLQAALLHVPYQPAAVALLLAADPKWHPGSQPLKYLQGRPLGGVQWRGAVLTGADLRQVTMGGADLSGASAQQADFEGADLTGANCVRASMNGASFMEANLSLARFEGANLASASFSRTTLSDTDFSDARLDEASFAHCDLRSAVLHRGSLQQARLRSCNLEFLNVDRPDFHDATFNDCCLTGSRFHHAQLREASFVNCGLADVQWENADLRDADFAGSTFHMGSTRSGLVNSVIASEGTRTGFYTDDYGDQDYRPAEEIRKANLCGADLRGAAVENTDFYLVDLRGATYSEEQAAHFARCGAILHSPSRH